jgi:hypothetical protein
MAWTPATTSPSLQAFQVVDQLRIQNIQTLTHLALDEAWRRWPTSAAYHPNLPAIPPLPGRNAPEYAD